MKNERKNIVAVLAMCCFLGAVTWITPAMQLIMEAFPDQNPVVVMQVATLPSLIGMFGIMMIGTVVGRKIRFKTCMILALLLVAGSGLIPVLFPHSFVLLLVARVITGVAMGMFGVRNAYIIRSFAEPIKSKVLGWVMLTTNGTSIFMQIASGWLGKISWNYAFLPYLAALIPLILVVAWIEEPKSSDAVNETKATSGVRVEKRAWGFILTEMIVMMLMNPITVNMSVYMAQKQLGDSAVAGIVLSCMTVSGALTGLFYDKIKQSTGKYFWALMFGCCCVGGILLLTAKSVIMLYLATAFWGITVTLLFVSMPQYAGEVSPPATLSFTVSLVSASGSLGCYAATYWAALCSKVIPVGQSDVEKCTMAMVAATLVFTVVSLVKDFRPSDERTVKNKF